MTWRFIWVLTASLVSPAVHAGEVMVAVAANVSVPMQKIAKSFEQDTGHKAQLAFGATGKFYAQIKNGAPFAVLLAADAQTPARLEKEGFAVAGTRFTYATGRLALWSKSPIIVDNQGEILRSNNLEKLGIQKIAMADPKLSPYGAAAMAVVQRMGLQATLATKWVQGESMGQTYQFVSTENAQLGFVALSQISIDGRINQGSAWVVPQSMHAPLTQDAVLLKTGQNNAAARALLKYLQGDTAKTILRSYGYALAE